ncbi:hypothetical protein MNBD_GAMMA12-3268 [hydrothermal vent metagenome]|uniref:Uncharacterized protein n=1 Tax=hydrothermal vent metagenome TaxID=652676 RepID=A0A3B0YX79_9ZZZZ
MKQEFNQFASALADDLLTQEETLKAHPEFSHKLQAIRSENEKAILDLTPFITTPSTATAAHFFAKVTDSKSFISAYHAARASTVFETDIPSIADKVSPFAQEFLNDILDSAITLTTQQVTIIADWVKNLDVYCAVKAIESLLNSKADISLLEMAHDCGWNVHFDHLAIRCGNQKNHDAEQVAKLLIDEHGYVASQVTTEAYYQFPDGWNAYPVYKILDNGQILRLFIDQSDDKHPNQIIQHWNKVYGFTAHHLAMRATTLINNQRVAVPLSDVMHALKKRGINIMSPTGHYTSGLLLQVFTSPERETKVPQALKQELVKISENLPNIINNGKLLELVSRREMDKEFAERLFSLYGLKFNAHNPLHSAPVYQYFLPAQAQHVIKSSQAVA